MQTGQQTIHTNSHQMKHLSWKKNMCLNMYTDFSSKQSVNLTSYFSLFYLDFCAHGYFKKRKKAMCTCCVSVFFFFLWFFLLFLCAGIPMKWCECVAMVIPVLKCHQTMRGTAGSVSTFQFIARAFENAWRHVFGVHYAFNEKFQKC